MRMTRAALRAQAHDDTDTELHPTIIHEDGDADALQNSNSEDSDGANHDPYSSRPVLKDITHDNYTITEDVNATEKHTNAVDEETAPALPKKTRGKRKGKPNKKEKEEDTSVEDTSTKNEKEADTEEQAWGVAEDIGSGDPSFSSEAVRNQERPQEPSHTVSEETEYGNKFISETVSDPMPWENVVTDQLPVSEVLVAPEPVQPNQLHDFTSTRSDSLHNSTSAAGDTGSDPPKTPKFDPSIHVPNDDVATPATDTAEDSFVDKIKTRSPSKIQSYTEVSPSDCSIENTMTRISRIEDSVDAIDALEDAIEKVSEGLPVLGGLQIESPVKSRKNTPTRQPAQSCTPAPSAMKTRRSPTKNSHISPTKTTTVVRSSGPTKPTIVRPSAPKPASKPVAMTKQAKKPIIDGNKPRESIASSHPALSFSNSPSKGVSNTSQKRVPSTRLSTTKPAFVPAKSSKPPTKPTFSLPGEAISAKLKAQREERLKREEEAEKERKQFKARPVPTKTSRPSVVPRENKASQARMSLYATGVNKENIAPKAASRPAAADPKPRPSSFCAKPSSDQTRANSGIRRATSVMEKPLMAKPRVSSLQLASGQKSTVTKDDVAQQKVKGKEVFSRNKAEMERLEKERKEKEEATRRARAEAAERGRQASREWAEKQKKKMATQAAVKESGSHDGNFETQSHSTAVAASS
ncbi:hypothetical protein A1O3_06347 [Capronia epimyces CBS 606.96]|uniref:Carboxylesterase family protein n=1 Tax=Capronia epimyces CBS 606.96 TaxID=1182542 RepID=W9YJU2_9EURO|nr:uncharacterized protein A1O3_06347 [Capronia epimyces CBS 606.96]EXJ82534.1 hypothetical protein A1O3_06347 [Capronia epimyces CBS 606.96]